MSPSTVPQRTVKGQAVIGLGLAGLIVAAWLGVHVYGVYLHRWSAWSWLAVPLLVALQTWLSVGLFIVAHDAMHGSLAPGRPGVNLAVGRAALALYAGFRFGRLNTAHHAHHRAPGTEADPDFYAADPRLFAAWFVNFFRTYFGWFELAVLTLATAVAVWVLKAPMANLLVFWAAPALLSALQLFVFGTWLPHRAADAPFVDAHNARSSGFGSLLSLLTCFHFGRHHEHHLQPWLPWWRLDAAARAYRDGPASATPTLAQAEPGPCSGRT